MEEELFMELGGKSSRITKKAISFLYEIEFDDDIKEPHNYREDMEVFRNASENDLIRIHVNTSGGLLESVISYITNMQATEGSTIAVLESVAHSGGSMVFLQADEHMVSPHAAMLIHESTFGCYDSSAKLHSYVDFTKKHTYQVYHDYYKDFLTVEEIDGVLDGKDMWLNADEIIERLHKRAEIRNKSEEDEIVDVSDYPEVDMAEYVECRVKHLCDTYKKSSLLKVASLYHIQCKSKDTKAVIANKLVYEKNTKGKYDIVLQSLDIIENNY